MPTDEIDLSGHGQQQRKRPPPPIDWLRGRFEYDPETGIIWHRQRDLFGNRRRADAPGPCGYRQASTEYEKHTHCLRAHRLAFALMTGRWPNVIDHLDGNRSNNRWPNLIDTTNAANLKRASEFLGISKEITDETRQGLRWKITIPAPGKRRSTTRRDFCAAWKLRQAWLDQAAAQEAHG